MLKSIKDILEDIKKHNLIMEERVYEISQHLNTKKVK